MCVNVCVVLFSLAVFSEVLIILAVSPISVGESTLTFGEQRAGASSDSRQEDEKEIGGCGWVHVGCSLKLILLCNPRSGIFGVEGRREAPG